MTPQLFINYRLKSVAHLPWKFFMYKALNTFIDDLFAFIIKMPTLHRMSCFRDDIVFLIFLYQRWIYKVDNSRVNEYGQRGDDGEPAPQTAPNGKTKKPKGGAAREAEGTQDQDRELSAAELKAVKTKGKEAAKGGAGEDTATQGGAGGRKKEPKKTK